MRVAAAQLAPVFLDRIATIERVVAALDEAADVGARLVVFPETFVPGYPSWTDFTAASHFDHPDQKATFERYLANGVDVAGGDLGPVVDAAARHGQFVYLGVAERSVSGGSLYCSLVAVHPERGIVGVHRKLQPTYGERLVWADGDGAGLVVHDHDGVRLSGLNCWENWMPLARAAMWAQGPQIHAAVWPGSPAVSHDASRFVAQEGRVFVVSAGAVLRAEHLPDDLPVGDEMRAAHHRYASGGAIIVAPDGSVLATADPHEERLLLADLDLGLVGRARHNFDPAGHYSRPDVLHLTVDRRRREPARFED
jgi:nitrilase